MIQSRFVFFILICLINYNPQSLAAQELIDTLDREIPFDPRVVVGKLPNGLTYYILEEESFPKVILNLVVKAGSNQESLDQLELAHLLEHLPFVRTKHFKSPREFFIGQGLKFGEDFSANTRPDHTRYFLQVPWDNNILFDSALMFLRDCAHDFTMTEKDVDKERGVILGELRRSTSHTSELKDQFIKNILPENGFKNRSYSVRKENINTFNRSSLNSYFNDWYNPQNEFLLIIGKVKAKEVIRKIEDFFSDLQNHGAQRQSRMDKAHFIPGVKVFFASHTEMQNYEVQIHMKLPVQKLSTYRDLESTMIQELYNKLMVNRLSGVSPESEKGNDRAVSTYRPKFSELGPTFSEILTTLIFETSADPFSKFKNIATELHRVKVHGFSDEEISEAKKMVLRELLSYNSPDIRNLSDQYIDHIMEGAPAPGAKKLALIKSFMLERIDSEQVNNTVKEWFDSRFIDIVFLSPAQKENSLPSEEAVVKWTEGLQNSDVSKFISQKFINAVSSKLDSIIAREQITPYKVEKIATTGVKKVQLNNGITLLLKSAKPSGSGQISLLGVAPGGWTLFPDSLSLLSYYGPAIVTGTGIGDLDSKQLNEFLRKNEILAFPYVNRDAAGFYSIFSQGDLDAALQVILGYMMYPKMDSAVAAKVIYQVDTNSSTSKLQGHHPAKVFNDTILRETNLDDRDSGPFHKPGALNVEKAQMLYNTIFSGTNNFTFILVGDFSEDLMLNKLIKYFSILPKFGQRIHPKFERIKPKYGIKKRIYLGSIPEKAAVHIKAYGNYKYNTVNNIQHEFLKSILYNELMQKLRVELGGTYDVVVSQELSKMNGGFYIYSISFECAPDRIDELTNSALLSIEDVRSKAFIERNLSNVKQRVINRTNFDLQHAAFWESYLKRQIATGSRIDEIAYFDKDVKEISVKSLLAVSKKWLQISKISVFQLLPEQGKQ